MGRKKSANTQRDQYAIWKAVEIAVEMIDCEELDAHGPRTLMLEAVDAASWDDIVVEWAAQDGERPRTFWQIKRQNVPIDQDAIKKLFQELDTALKSARAGDRFCFGTPAEIQLELLGSDPKSFRLLRDLCEAARKTGVNPTTLVAKGQANEKAWCGFLKTCITDTTNQGVAAFLSRLEIHELGTESEVRARCVERLKSSYRNAADVVDKIFAHLVQSADGRIELTYRVLHDAVLQQHGVREPTRLQWLRATRPKSWGQWHISGPLAPKGAVAAAWSPTADGAVLRIAATPQGSGDEVEAALLRLVVHRSAAVRAEATDREAWVRYARKRTGGTLGFSSDCSDVGLLDPPASLPAPSTEPTLPKALADQLQGLMGEYSWNSLRARVDAILSDPEPHGLDIHSEILAAMAPLWRSWELELQNDENLRRKFLGMCVATKEEWGRNEFDRGVRVGQASVDPIAKAIAMTLAIGTSFAASGLVLLPGATEGGNLTIGELSLHLIALSHASKPGSNFGAKITDAAPHFLAEEIGCTILAATEARPEDLELTSEGQAVPYHIAKATRADYQSSYSPKPLLTNEVGFSRALKAGAFALRQFLADRFARFAEAEWSFLQEAVGSEGDEEDGS